MVDHSSIEVNVDGNSPQGAVEIKGSPDHDLYTRVQMTYRSLQDAPELKSIEAEFQKAASAKDESKMDQLRGVYVKELEKQQTKIADLLKQPPPSLSLFNILQPQNLISTAKTINLLSHSLPQFQ